MSQLVTEIDAHAIDPAFDLEYKPLTPLAPVSLVLGICSAAALLGLIGVAIAVISLIVGVVALWRILRSNGELSGKALAIIGLVLSLTFTVSGGALQAYSFATEVPEGFARINFTQDISRKEFVYERGIWSLHPDVKALEGSKIFIKGYMYPTRQTQGIKTFIMVKDNQQCCFGGQPKLNDMMLIDMQEGKESDYIDGLVAVAGIFHAKSPSEGGQLRPVYEIEGMQLTKARNSF